MHFECLSSASCQTLKVDFLNSFLFNYSCHLFNLPTKKTLTGSVCLIQLPIERELTPRAVYALPHHSQSQPAILAVISLGSLCCCRCTVRRDPALPDTWNMRDCRKEYRLGKINDTWKRDRKKSRKIWRLSLKVQPAIILSAGFKSVYFS